MALRDQPYLPLYVQDYLTDEKLSCCTLSTQGVYIRILCILHKSETYGGILFKQIPKQNFSSNQFFAYIISKQIGVESQYVSESIEELLFFNVLTIEKKDGVDFLYQKRMVRDFEISCKRSNVAKKGGGNPKLKTKNLFKQKDKQNTEYENEYEYENEINNNTKKGVEKFDFKKSLIGIGVEEKVASDWLVVRKNKKGANTETAFNSIKLEIEKSGHSANDCIKKAVEKDWRGFEAKWFLNEINNTNGTVRQTYVTSTKDTAEQRRAKIIAHATANTQQCTDDLQERGNIFEVVQSLEANAVSGQ